MGISQPPKGNLVRKVLTGSHVIQPPISVPCPTGNRTVDDRRPKEAKDKRGDKAPTLKCATDDNLDGTSAEQQLVQAKDNLWNSRVAGRRGGHDILETKIVQVTDERTGRSAIGQTVSPEHPLHRYNGRDHERLEEESQGRLSAGETTVKEADTGDDEPDNIAAKHQVGVVPLVADILSIDVDLERIAAVGLGLVVTGLMACQST